jgi:hypothetical protein
MVVIGQQVSFVGTARLRMIGYEEFDQRESKGMEGWADRIDRHEAELGKK